MKNSNFLKITVILASIVILFQCQKNPVPYDLSDPDVYIDTLTIRGISGGTYYSPPLMGSSTGLYFGNEDGNENLYTLLRFRNLSYNNSVYTYNLLDEDVEMDSIVFSFTALDSNLLVNNESFSNITFELYYFPDGGDSLFDENESNYFNLSETDILNSVAIGQGHFIKTDEDSIYPKLSINVIDMAGVLDFIADTNDTENRTFMLKNIDPINGIIGIRSRESSNYPLLTAHYQVGEDTLQSNFYPIEDVTIVKPRDITEEDKTNLTVCRASGLKSILQIDLSEIPFDSTTMVFKSAELYINTTSLDTLADWTIVGTVLDTLIDVSDYWEEFPEDNYTIEDDVTMTGSFEFNQLEMQIRDFLQGYMTGSYDNYGLKIYISSSSDPFKTIHFLINQEDESLNPYIKITYVKL